MTKKKRDFSKEMMESGVTRQQALDITTEFLDWYIEFLQESQPEATRTIKHLEETLNSLDGNINEVCETY